jgi:hypothetical protein
MLFFKTATRYHAARFIKSLTGKDKTISRKSALVLNPSTKADHPLPLRASDGAVIWRISRFSRRTNNITAPLSGCA